MTKSIIGVVGRTEKIINKINVVYLNEKLRKKIISKDGLPFLILPIQDCILEDMSSKDIPKLTSNEKELLRNMIDACDGIIMPGGNRLYEYDFYIYEYALSKNIPILGICAGMQLMGLYDKLGDKLKKVADENLHKRMNDKYVHHVDVNSDSLLYKIIGKKNIMVNSQHKYYLSNVNNLKISARSDDGIIEAVEFSDKDFVLGVQWHPEGMLDYDEDANKIIDAFMMATKNK